MNLYSLLKNLGKKRLELLITTIIAIISLSSISKFINWLLVYSNWSVIKNNFLLYLVGIYPKEESWRPLLWLISLAILILLTLIDSNNKFIKKIIPSLWISIIPMGLILLSGGFGLKPVLSSSWGGLALTLTITLVSLVIALIAGIFLAIGRQSNLIVIRNSCRLYIDLMRSIPLISILFFGQLLIPLFLPKNIEANQVFRAVIAFSLFAAAYIAEDIRGGLQSVPPTQKEAAAVLGLNSIQAMSLIIVPQALITSLPSLTNQAIGLLQNTSLMAILGLVELLGISRSILANPEYINRYLEVYIWLAFIYWIACTALALLSRKLERQLSFDGFKAWEQ